jgi:hypothetical protein
MSHPNRIGIVLGSLVLAVLAVSGVGVAAPTGGIRPVSRPHAASQLKTLSVSITREAQLAALNRGPKSLRDALAAAQSQVGSFHGGSMLEAAAWKEGIVLTPLALAWTSPVPNPISSASFASACVLVGPGDPLPSPDQNPPVLHLQVDREELSQYHALCYVDCVPPSSGPYLITLNLTFEGNTKLIRGNLAPPIVTLYTGLDHFPPVASYVTVVGDVSDPTKATCWTGLLNFPDAKRKQLSVVWPNGGNYRWTGVTIRKL